MIEFEGKVAVVTGGGSGIGRGIALGLAAEGMALAIADVNAASAETVADEVTAQGGRAIAIAVDVTAPDSLAAAAKEVEAQLGGVNLLCANAGVLARIAPLADHSIEDWEYTLGVNVLGVVKTVNAFLPLLLESAPEAHVVNTASLGGLIATEGFPIGAYIASKYACVGYSEMLRAELAPQGVGVSVLCPGVVASSLVDTSTRNRPEGFGTQPAPKMEVTAADADRATAQVTAMPAEEVGPIVVEAVRNNRLHVITHPDSRPVVERRFAQITADYDFAAQRKSQA